MANTPIDIFDFLHELTKVLASAAGIVYEPIDNKPRYLFRVQAPEDPGLVADPYHVITPYTGGRVPAVATLTLPIQCLTRGTGNEATFTASHTMYSTLFDATSKLALRNVDLGSPAKYRLLMIQNIRPPGLLGRGKDNRAEVAFNFDAVAVPLS